ncbi:voltage-dependent T-type calcium channel subunit alpha-1H-like [Pungitius pungitius]|uniref:voltage-dependent T-type calcium channel subunit alpha-1H-like n=1 Tax=Pungitius pungitius TaxID=134920 RepID=UPI002E10C644
MPEVALVIEPHGGPDPDPGPEEQEQLPYPDLAPVVFFDFFLTEDYLGLHLQVLGPFRLISRVASMHDIVSVLLVIFPMLANVLFLYMFVMHIFGVIGVQLWAGRLHNRCFLGEDPAAMYNVSLSPYYVTKYGELQPFLCSPEDMSGLHCAEVPPFRENEQVCSVAPAASSVFGLTGAGTNACVNWNVLYNVCLAGAQNPNDGATNFDNIGYAWISIFQVVTLEGWSNIMFYVMNVYSSWSVFYFIFVAIMGSFIMMNVCVVVIATQYSDNLERLRSQRTVREDSAALLEWLRPKWTGCLAAIRRRASNRVRHHDPDSRADDSTVGGHIWRQLTTRLEKVIKSKIFNRLIMSAVVLSILTLAIEHHDQPNELTNMLQISDIAFTVIFVAEMLLKVMGLNWAYFQDRNNLFDFVIVIISLWETTTKADGRLSVLRAFRLLRFGRLLHYLPYLRTQLLVLKKAMQDAASLCMLMLFVIFIFSLLGMHLFGHRSDTLKEIRDRKYFDTLLWSMVTVFQILTGEDWNRVLYTTMAATSPWAFIYFVAVIVTGKHVLLNILVGIVLQGFQDRRTLREDHASVTSPPTPEDGSADANGDEENRTLAESPASVTPSPTLEDGSADANGDEENRPQNRIQAALRWCKKRKEWSLYALSPQNRFRLFCKSVTSHNSFEYTVLIFILLNCVTIAMERPGIEAASKERMFLTISGYIFSAVFMVEMIFKVLTLGLFFGSGSYCRSAWNVMDGSLVVASLVDVVVLLSPASNSKMLGILKVLRLLRTLRPLRVINRAPKLKLAVEALITALKPVGNILLMCCAFIFFYAILGLQLFKGKFYSCSGEYIDDVANKADCLSADYRWEQKDFNFDNLPQALMSLFVMYSKDGWVSLMYDGLDAVGVDQQPVTNNNEWMLLFFISFMIVSFFLLDMFIGVMVDTFHDCQKRQKKLAEEARDRPRRSAGEQRGDRKGGRGAADTPFQASYSRTRLFIHTLCTNEQLDLLMAALIFISVLIMAVEHYQQPLYILRLTEYSHYVFTSILAIEVLLKLVAFGGLRFLRNSWNLTDLVVVSLSLVSIVLSAVRVSRHVPVNPTILRVFRVLRLAQVVKAKKIRVLLTTIIKTLLQVGNICLLFLFFFSIYATLGVELFGHLECAEDDLCLGLNEYVNFKHFGMALFTLFLLCTGDNWSVIMMDTLKQCRLGECAHYLVWVSSIYFITFVVIAQFVLANLVVAVIVQAMEDSNKDEGLSAANLVVSGTSDPVH